MPQIQSHRLIIYNTNKYESFYYKEQKQGDPNKTKIKANLQNQEHINTSKSYICPIKMSQWLPRILF